MYIYILYIYIYIYIYIYRYPPKGDKLDTVIYHCPESPNPKSMPSFLCQNYQKFATDLIKIFLIGLNLCCSGLAQTVVKTKAESLSVSNQSSRVSE